jgi:hypothetical protein
MKLPKSQKDFEELMKGIKWNRIIPPAVSVLQPVIIGGLWLVACRFDKRADATAKFIAIAETIPTLDLNIPQPVALASIYHTVDETMDVLKEVIDWIKDLEVPTAEDMVEEAKDQITDPVAETVDDILPDDPAFKTALANCVMNAKKNLGLAYWILGPTWIQSCMLQKGFSVGVDWLKKELDL